MSTPDSGSRSKASFAQTSWTVVEGAGHFLHLERPEQVNTEIMGWIG